LFKNFRKWEMDNHTYGEVFEREAPRSSRPSRSTTQFRTSYNEDLMSPNIGDEGDDGDAHPSTFPCTNFLSDAGILDDFLLLVDRIGLTTYMLDESNKYVMLTIFFLRALNFLTPPSSHLLHLKFMISLSPCLWRDFAVS
jgi:hypothetical protein